MINGAGDPEEINYTTVGASVTTITSNLNDMTRGMRLMAALIDNENDADNLMQVGVCWLGGLFVVLKVRSEIHSVLCELIFENSGGIEIMRGESSRLSRTSYEQGQGASTLTVVFWG